MVEPVRPIAIEDIEAGARAHRGHGVSYSAGDSWSLATARPEIWLKLENLQPTNAYKIRGAANAVARLSDEERAKRRVDDQRGKCWARRRLRRAAVRDSVRRWSRSRPRRKPSSTE